MNVEEKVATLEALLARVKNNAARPRIPRPAEAAEPIGGARLAAPEPAVAASKAPDEKRVEKVAPARIEPPATPDALDAQLDKLLQPTIEKPVEARVELLDVWTDALKEEVPKAAVAPPIVAPMAAKVDGGTPKAAPIAARSITPAVATPVAVRSTAPAARPVAPRPFGAKTEVTPSPAPTAAKVVEKIAPAITPPKAIEKVAPIVAAPKPIEKVAPIVAAPKPVEKIAPIVAAEKVETIAAVKVAGDEIRVGIEAPPPLPKTAETKAAELPTAAAVVATPVKVPPLPVVASKATPDEDVDVDEHVTQDDETVMLHGSIPEATPPIVTDETTTDEETIVSLPTSDDIAAKAAGDIDDDKPTTDASSTIDNEEPTHVFQGRVSRPEAGSPATVKIDLDEAPASKSDELKVVVSPSVRALITADAATADEPVRAIKITEAVPAPRASDSGEATAPSRRYSNPDPESEEVALPPVPTGKRPSARMLGLVAAALIGAGVFVGLRNGWFGGSSTPGVPTAPTASGPAPTASTAAITTASAAPIASTPVPTTSAVVAPTDSASAVPSASAMPSASAAPSASVAPSVTASSAPTAPPVAAGDGTALPPNRGYVIINSAKPASVFLTGNFAGLTGAKLEVECGAKFLRLAAPIAAGTERPATPDWTSEGRSISVVCRSTTTVALEATR